jgi:two-component system NtrC family sensor kinase
MNPSIAPLIISWLLSQRFLNFAKINNHPQWVRLFKYAKFFSIFLFAAEVILSAASTTRWIWHIFLLALVVFAIRQKEMRALQMYILAFVPYIIISFLSDITQVISSDFYNRWSNYFNTAVTLTYIWLVAIFFSQYRQNKAAEKERIKRKKEDELNRAIAIRKVELEGLVAERTAEISMQKEELEQTLNKLRTSQTQLIQSEKMASLGELTAGIAHEIQNPLNFVNNFSEVNKELLEEMNEEIDKGNLAEVKLIVKDVVDNEQKINHHGKRADAIVKGMLQHSRTNSGIKKPTDINALADEYLRLAYHGLRAKDKSFNAEFTSDFDMRIGKINAVPQEIGRVILNLLNNAFYAVSEKKKMNPEGYKPLVSIRTQKVQNNVEIVVKDNGNGIPQKMLDKIFQPFFTTKPTGKGTGLGLSISYDIITKGHKGELIAKTNEGTGTEFKIIIPITE